MNDEKQKRTGRPRKEINRKHFENLCGIQCSQEEICQFFEVTDKTLNSWCKREYGKGFSEVFKAKRGIGKISLRRTQWKLAEKSPAMAIFLGKNYLGQTDRIEQTINEVENLAPLADMLNEDDTED